MSKQTPYYSELTSAILHSLSKDDLHAAANALTDWFISQNLNTQQALAVMGVVSTFIMEHMEKEHGKR